MTDSICQIPVLSVRYHRETRYPQYKTTDSRKSVCGANAQSLQHSQMRVWPTKGCIWWKEKFSNMSQRRPGMSQKCSQNHPVPRGLWELCPEHVSKDRISQSCPKLCLKEVLRIACSQSVPSSFPSPSQKPCFPEPVPNTHGSQ